MTKRRREELKEIKHDFFLFFLFSFQNCPFKHVLKKKINTSTLACMVIPPHSVLSLHLVGDPKTLKFSFFTNVSMEVAYEV